MPWTPHDMPFVVEKARRGYLELLDTHRTNPSLQNAPNHDRVVRSLEEVGHFLEAPELSWMDTNVCELIESTLSSLPDWSPQSCIPSPSGLIGLERSTLRVPYESAWDDAFVPVDVAAIGWETRQNTLRVFTLAYTGNIPGDVRSPLRKNLALEVMTTSTVPLDEDVSGLSVQPVASISLNVEDFAQAAEKTLATLGSVWLLLAQDRVLNEAPATVKVKKRGRSGDTYRSPVSVSVRSLTTRSRSTGSSKGGREKATTRWWVRGHWRQQAWGKDRALRKPVYIAPHTAGAKDADVDTRPKVQVIRE